VTIEHIANTLPASHIPCAKFRTNGKRKEKRNIIFTHSLVLGGGICQISKKEEEMYLFLPHFFLGFREKGREGWGGHFLY
jgi:hypothetical protein